MNYMKINIIIYIFRHLHDNSYYFAPRYRFIMKWNGFKIYIPEMIVIFLRQYFKIISVGKKVISLGISFKMPLQMSKKAVLFSFMIFLGIDIRRQASWGWIWDEIWNLCVKCGSMLRKPTGSMDSLKWCWALLETEYSRKE